MAETKSSVDERETRAPETAEFYVQISRVFDAPRALVYEAFTTPSMLAEWMGPRGFEARDIEHDVRPGGKWRVRLHRVDAEVACDSGGQDDLWQAGTYVEVVPPERLVYTFSWEGRADIPFYETTITATFRELEGKTVMNFKQGPFGSAAWRDGHENGWTSSFDRFAEFLLAPVGAEKAADLVIERVFDAPVEVVWRAWTDAAQMAQWWSPKHFTNPVCRADVRPGGEIYIEMRAPDGTIYPMGGRFEDVVPMERLVFTSAALDGEGKPKFELHTTISLRADGGRTALRLEARVVRKISPDAQQHLGGMGAGWSQSLDKLEAFVASEKMR